jgi:hypothetical protein
LLCRRMYDSQPAKDTYQSAVMKSSDCTARSAITYNRIVNIKKIRLGMALISSGEKTFTGGIQKKSFTCSYVL